jgi:hypothetical protein
MFLIFLISFAALRGAISDAQSVRATEMQSMKWLTELRCEIAMNRLSEFIVVKRNRVQRCYRLNTVQQVACDKCFESCRRTFTARSDRQTNSRRREALDAVPTERAAGKNIVAIADPTINASRHCRMTERTSLFFAGARQPEPAIPSS